MKIFRTLAVLVSEKARLKYKRELSQTTGLIMDESFTKKDNCRLLNLFIRAVMVLFLTLGSIDGFLSAFNIVYDRQLVFGTIIAANFIIMLLQLNGTLRLLGYALGIWQLIVFYLNHLDLMKSGIKAIINTSYELMRLKFALPYSDGFTEYVPDRSLTVPAFVIVMGLFFLILMWECCGRFINLILATIVTFLAIAPALYFDGTPDLMSVFMLGTGWLIAACLKFNGKADFSFRQKDQNKITQYPDRQIYRRQIHGKAIAQLFCLICVIMLLLGGILGRVVTPEVFDSRVPTSKLKSFSDFMLKDTMIIMFSKFKNYEIRGSVSSGQLGQYSSVKLDHKPDLEITYVPTTADREYLRTFIGTDYSNNSWTTKEGLNNKQLTNLTAQAARQKGLPFEKMRIKNLGLISDKPYLPYYTDLDSNSDIKYADDNNILMELPENAEYTVEYCRQPDIVTDDAEYKKYVYENFLYVPDENREPIEKLCAEKGFKADDPELTQKLADYFAQDFKYTLSPGLVPWKTDFVNYFLFEHKEGVCAHFASAGTLIYRTLGIPARYAEGYALDYVMARQDQTMETSENPTDWYSGADALTPVPVTVQVKDHSAHAWVEIYKDGYGWVPAELTPINYEELEKMEEKDNDPDVSDQVMTLFLSSTEEKKEQSAEILDDWRQKAAEVMGYLTAALFGAFLLLLAYAAALVAYRHIKRLKKFAPKNEDSVIALYSYIIDILTYLGKLENTSHNAVGAALSPYIRTPDVITDTVQQILYAPDMPEKTECENVFISLHNALEKILKECKLGDKLKILIKL